jgi:hypothetical protein
MRNTRSWVPKSDVGILKLNIGPYFTAPKKTHPGPLRRRGDFSEPSFLQNPGCPLRGVLRVRRSGGTLNIHQPGVIPIARTKIPNLKSNRY